ncbi:endoglucanase A-like [Gigantopelta aegis]|uniref:endoglucanase A-like n=1 Tax=Gigantopelta aegis TaxID=1735272 RepID=UPI001B88AB02|nr:endoglucanase A-like [Gigantopelta aegis]
MSTSPSHTTPTPDEPSTYNFSRLLELSILFYEAQRSGHLPANNRVPWRNHSALTDGSDVELDLTGGWYDAGDTIKFTLPMAASVTRLAWSLIMWPDAYSTSGQTEYMFDCIKWPLDYFLKCWNSATQVFYVQVGDIEHDHAVWTRPQDMTMPRPAYSVTTSNPGSDVAGNTAAAMAAGAIAFKTKDSVYSARLLTAARTLYDFAVRNTGIYSVSVPQAHTAYGSSGYKDELSLAAVWLYKATGEQHYLDAAVDSKPTWVPWALDWDDKSAAAALLIYQETGGASFRTLVTSFISSYMPGGTVSYTPCGLAFRLKWGSLRYTANVAMLALLAADSMGGEEAESYRSWAYGQIAYMLGDNNYNMSYLIGYSDFYPRRPHHQAASCDSSSSCNWATLENPDPNPHNLLGALVGGPGRNDDYDDVRADYVKNEVTVDYNAGFQAAVAGLLHLKNMDALPTPSLIKEAGCAS